MKKISTMQAFGVEIFKEQKLTIGVDLGDRWNAEISMAARPVKVSLIFVQWKSTGRLGDGFFFVQLDVRHLLGSSGSCSHWGHTRRTFD